MKKILLTGGGTAGHLIPLLAVVDELKKKEKTEFLLLTPASDFNQNISDAGIQTKIIKAGKLRRYFSWKNFTDIFKIVIGLFQSFYFIYKFKPNIVFSKGGFASIPPVVAAWILRIPILTHESDIVPGLANKIISRFSDKIFTSFADTEKYFSDKKAILTGNPIRKSVLGGDKNEAKEIFNLKEDIPTILIFGGSQGARKINEIILESLPELLKKYQVIHICGDKNFEELKKAIDNANSPKTTSANVALEELVNRYRLFSYLNKKLKDAYALCDVVVSRAGANSLSEIIALAKPSIVIPLPTSANNHQLRNAKFFAEKEMAFVIEEKDLSAEKMIKELDKLLSNDEIKNKITRNMKQYNISAKQNAAEIIATTIINN